MKIKKEIFNIWADYNLIDSYNSVVYSSDLYKNYCLKNSLISDPPFSEDLFLTNLKLYLEDSFKFPFNEFVFNPDHLGGPFIKGVGINHGPLLPNDVFINPPLKGAQPVMEKRPTVAFNSSKRKTRFSKIALLVLAAFGAVFSWVNAGAEVGPNKKGCPSVSQPLNITPNNKLVIKPRFNSFKTPALKQMTNNSSGIYNTLAPANERNYWSFVLNKPHILFQDKVISSSRGKRRRKFVNCLRKRQRIVGYLDFTNPLFER